MLLLELLTTANKMRLETAITSRRQSRLRSKNRGIIFFQAFVEITFSGTQIVIHSFAYYIENAITSLQAKGAIPIISSLVRGSYTIL